MRGVVGPVYAMRPCLPQDERQAVTVAARQIWEAKQGSTPATAREIAARVWRHMEDMLDADDEVTPLMARLVAITGGDPAMLLATCPDIDTAALVRAERLARFEARGCRQLSAGDWQAEGRAIGRIVRARLARRYARIIRAAQESCS